MVNRVCASPCFRGVLFVAVGEGEWNSEKSATFLLSRTRSVLRVAIYCCETAAIFDVSVYAASQSQVPRRRYLFSR